MDTVVVLVCRRVTADFYSSATELGYEGLSASPRYADDQHVPVLPAEALCHVNQCVKVHNLDIPLVASDVKEWVGALTALRGVSHWLFGADCSRSAPPSTPRVVTHG